MVFEAYFLFFILLFQSVTLARPQSPLSLWKNLSEVYRSPNLWFVALVAVCLNTGGLYYLPAFSYRPGNGDTLFV